VVCGYEDHADHKAAVTLASRWGDRELAACRDKKEVKGAREEGTSVVLETYRCDGTRDRLRARASGDRVLGGVRAGETVSRSMAKRDSSVCKKLLRGLAA
jgi:hypothetical protein